MSVVVAVKKEKHAAIGADTAQTADSWLMGAGWVENHKKILQSGDTYIGMTGWSATQDVVESILCKHGEDLNFDGRINIVESARKLHTLMKKDYFLDTQEDKDQPVESSQIEAIIANASGIYELEAYRAVAEFSRFWAIGSGKSLAMGAMHAVYDTTDDVEAIARAGLEAACTFDDGCLEPLTIYPITLK